MLVVAFDGILFDTLELRTTAVEEALGAEGFRINHASVREIVAGRSISESVRAAAELAVTNAPVDETAVDLATLRAERALRALGAHGAQLNVAVRDRLRRAVAVSRIVIRADSLRRDVDALLALSDLESLASLVRCSDDLSSSSVVTNQPRLSSIERSYEHIAKRLYGNMTLLGTSADIGIALEVGETGRAAARRHGFNTPPSFDAPKLPGA